jgi:hypothetical protein
MDRSHFYEANKTSLVFFLFFYDFLVNLQDLCFYRKKEKKSLHARDLAHNKAGPTSAQVKKKPTRRGSSGSKYFVSGTPIYFKNY